MSLSHKKNCIWILNVSTPMAEIFFFPAKAWPESSCRKTSCESEACTSAPGEVRTKIACSHMPACHWPFICINSRDLWAAQISASCSSRQVSQPSAAQAASLPLPSRAISFAGQWRQVGTWYCFLTSGDILCLEGNPPLAGQDCTKASLHQLSATEDTKWRSWQSAFGLILFYRAQ